MQLRSQRWYYTGTAAGDVFSCHPGHLHAQPLTVAKALAGLQGVGVALCPGNADSHHHHDPNQQCPDYEKAGLGLWGRRTEQLTYYVRALQEHFGHSCAMQVCMDLCEKQPWPYILESLLQLGPLARLQERYGAPHMSAGYEPPQNGYGASTATCSSRHRWGCNCTGCDNTTG